jgi:hypothetical protein
MESLIHQNEDDSSRRLSRQALSFFAHTVMALASWFLLMLLGYALNPPWFEQGILPQSAILGASLLVPLLVGFIVNNFRQDDMAPMVWLLGLIWALIICLWVLDMPTGPGECFQCDATEKLSRTFFSWPSPSGLIDNDGPFLCTWPSAALLGYAIGARMALRKRPASDD